ncbi:MAG: MBOAT family protein, partial [Lachnospiraceae bacterium]|nr:MBOAT family protein [Lachnospiraceae bacterium]
MEFSSLTFLLYFIPIFFLIYLITPRSLKNVTLITGSYLFYLQGEWKYAWLLPLSIVINFLLGKFLDSTGEAMEGVKKKRKDRL